METIDDIQIPEGAVSVTSETDAHVHAENGDLQDLKDALKKKFGEQNFWVFSEMRNFRKILVTIWTLKIRNLVTKFKI